MGRSSPSMAWAKCLATSPLEVHQLLRRGGDVGAHIQHHGAPARGRPGSRQWRDARCPQWCEAAKGSSAIRAPVLLSGDDDIGFAFLDAFDGPPHRRSFWPRRAIWLGLSSIVTRSGAWRSVTLPLRRAKRASSGFSIASSPCSRNSGRRAGALDDADQGGRRQRRGLSIATHHASIEHRQFMPHRGPCSGRFVSSGGSLGSVGGFHNFAVGIMAAGSAQT